VLNTDKYEAVGIEKEKSIAVKKLFTFLLGIVVLNTGLVFILIYCINYLMDTIILNIL
jgi:hypothetical protein